MVNSEILYKIGATGQRSAAYGQGTGPIQLSQVQCVGSEAGILSCPGSTATQNCQHNQDAGVTCIPREYQPRTEEHVVSLGRLFEQYLNLQYLWHAYTSLQNALHLVPV